MSLTMFNLGHTYYFFNMVYNECLSAMIDMYNGFGFSFTLSFQDLTCRKKKQNSKGK